MPDSSNKFLDSAGLVKVIEQNDQRYVRKVDGKDLSSNDFTDEYKQKIDDLMYDEIKISSFSNTKSTNEKGSVITGSLNLTWALNKNPESLVLSRNGSEEVLDVNSRSKELILESDSKNPMLDAISANTSFTLKATDEREAVATRTTTISFVNGVYHGVAEIASADDITNDFILALNRELRSNRTKSFTVNAEANQKIVYAFPSSYGTPTFNVGGFDGGFVLAKTFDFTNASGYTESYDVWTSVNSGLGNTTVTVK